MAPPPLPPLITLEEHFISEAMLSSHGDKYSEQLKHIPGLTEKLADLDTLRLQHMDAGRVSLQIVSHAPGTISATQCRSANDQLARAIQHHHHHQQQQQQQDTDTNPNQLHPRLAGFAVLPVSDSGAACATELRRCIQSLNFVGALIDNHTSTGAYFDSAEYETTLFQTAQDLNVPIYLHPTWPTDAMRAVQYYTDPNPNTPSTISSGAMQSIATSGFGWHADVATHILRLFASGLFDRLPRLKIIIGHMGETLPFMLDRIVALSRRWGDRERDFKSVWDTNIYITTSGVWSVDPMACILRNTRIDHILYSVDYPFATNEDGLQFMLELQKSGLVTEEQLEGIAYRNAEKLLGVKVGKRWD
ncbi:amidohydrolase 2, partial [Aureobasidium melanogenum]